MKTRTKTKEEEVKIPSDERAASTAVPNSVVIRLKIPPPRPAEQPLPLGHWSRWHFQSGLVALTILARETKIYCFHLTSTLVVCSRGKSQKSKKWRRTLHVPWLSP
jgi:hypothetical protein